MSATVQCRNEKFEDFYDVMQELGRGQFAVVKKCISKENNQEVAAKFIKVKRSKASKNGLSKELIEREAGILFSVDHSKIIKLYDLFDIGTEIVLVLELLSGGELFDKICECEFLKEVDACFYMKQVLEAVYHIHSLNIVHLDIKPENIVLQSKNRNEIKLVDFGLAQRLTPGKDLKEMMGTPEFVAPEIVSYETIGCYTDMWAIGVLAFILLSGCSPFLGENNQETYEAIVKVDYDFEDDSFEQISCHAKDFISGLLVKQPADRLTAEECLKHDWLVYMSAPRARTESVFITTAKLKRYLAKRRWQQSFQKLNAINRFSKFMKKIPDEEKITEEISFEPQENLSIIKKMNDQTNLDDKPKLDYQENLSSIHQTKKPFENFSKFNGNLLNGTSTYSMLLTQPSMEETTGSSENILYNEINKDENQNVQQKLIPTLPIHEDAEKQENNRKISLAKRKYSRETQVRYTELRKEEEFVLIASEVVEEVESEDEVDNKTTELSHSLVDNNSNIISAIDQNNETQNPPDDQDQSYNNEKYDTFETNRKSSFRKKAVFVDHKNLINNQLSERKDRSVSFTESKKMDIIEDCEIEEVEGNLENDKKGDENKTHEKKTRKHVICAKTIGMEHLIDIILMDDPKETPVIKQSPIAPILTSIPNGIKVYKETSV
ncbi:death-associated protein kinase 1 isoform X1 [Hydra vulgaris]|uniref:death-associated protein kinase 1 isoform X1 n=1 Tax=Hydra vulgaris TaxID=6087 RepID=UPI0006414E80|nr:death-associated protein kinase 1 [Hydra vulgaris]XP_012558094.1 death-associated protein kinase 1 [Hydra vulgaris]XP_047140655.1 death-associated protein kinase 1 [Hydra vulgaris]